MRRFLTLVFMLCLAIPAGVSISGCTRNPAGNYCYGLAYGIKNTEVTTVILQPQTTGISLAYGQTQQLQTPQTYNCLNTSVSVSAKQITYGTTNNQLVDISPTGYICGGTWNRNTGGGIADYTYCNPPNPLPSTNGLPYGVATVTAAANSVTSNPVKVFVHAQVSSVALVGPQQCVSQTQTANLDAQACYSSNGKQYLLCAPSSITTASSPSLACPVAPGQTLAAIPSCTSSIGYFNFLVGTASIGTINSTSNQITANAPGTTAITASIAGSGSSAGFFSTCPPQSISLKLADGTTKGTITQGVQQNLNTTAFDTNTQECPPLGCSLTGLILDYQSTNPIDVGVSSNASVTAHYPGVASVYAICQPPNCNSSPINELGLNGTGLSISSNPVNITTPGTISDYVWFASPGLSQYFVPISLLSGTPGSTVRLPYVPNSMLMDSGGSNLYFGSARELMIFSISAGTLTKQDSNAPGVVLAVSPNGSQALISDQVRGLFYLYNVSAGTFTTQGGMGNAAAWTPDSKTLYITDNAALNNGTTITGHTDTLYVYSASTGWSTYPLPPSPLPAGSIPLASLAANVAVSPTLQTPALMIPGIGAYLRGTPTVAHTWCPKGTVTSAGSAITALYPGPDPPATLVATEGGDDQPVQSDVLAATTDGNHILGASLSGTVGPITLSDIAVSVPITACPSSTSGTTQTLEPLAIQHAATPYTQATLAVSATAVNQIIASPVSNLAFITYNGSGTGAQLPFYLPAANGAAGSVGYVALTGGSAITAPLAGSFTSDDSIFFVSTAGDNMVHYISIPANPSLATPPTDTRQISPNLPACATIANGGLDPGCTYNGTGTIVPATAIAVVPRATT